MQPSNELVEDSNTSNNTHFSDILNSLVNRRSVLQGGAGMTAAMMFGSTGLLGCSSDDNTASNPEAPVTELKAPETINFTPVEHSMADQVIVPDDYQVQAFLPLGLPIVSGLQDWSDTTARAGESFEFRIGDNHDGLWFYGLKDGKLDNSVSDRGLLAINHEYVDTGRLNPLGDFTRPVAGLEGTIYANQKLSQDVRREVNCHGVCVVEVVRGADNQFTLVKDSRFNRRITSATVIELTGPAAGSDLMKTKFDPSGLTTQGINNQCGSGDSPWGTYLTVEENYAGVFARSDDSAVISTELNNARNRYGLRINSAGGYLWHTPPSEEASFTDEFARWDITAGATTSATEDYRNAFHTFGYITEIDPFDPDARAVKRTALGRFSHENCGYAPVVVGEPVVLYMGDDARGEYVYKFVSEATWSESDAGSGLAGGQKFLDAGTLYVAKFNADGRGEWIELTFGKNGLDASNTLYPFSSQADVCIFTRLAADSVGATKMDRPEWVNASPITGEVYLTLTNNSQRGRSAQPLDAANPRNYDADGNSSLDGNVNGHVIRWKEDGTGNAATTFQWDVYLFGSPFDNINANLSDLTAQNDLSSPDGLQFDSRGVLWIQTDDSAYRYRTNCMMLVALPGTVGDGSSLDVNGVTTYVGAKPSITKLARFLVGPVESEITGITFTPDLKTLFISIQHPGERGTRAGGFASHWPASQTDPSSTALPRSALAVITRKDGGVILGETS